jgi:hypothetical protein
MTNVMLTTKEGKHALGHTRRTQGFARPARGPRTFDDPAPRIGGRRIGLYMYKPPLMP